MATVSGIVKHYDIEGEVAFFYLRGISDKFVIYITGGGLERHYFELVGMSYLNKDILNIEYDKEDSGVCKVRYINTESVPERSIFAKIVSGFVKAISAVVNTLIQIIIGGCSGVIATFSVVIFLMLVLLK